MHIPRAETCEGALGAGAADDDDAVGWEALWCARAFSSKISCSLLMISASCLGVVVVVVAICLHMFDCLTPMLFLFHSDCGAPGPPAVGLSRARALRKALGSGAGTGVCEKNTPFRQALAMQSSCRRCSQSLSTHMSSSQEGFVSQTPVARSQRNSNMALNQAGDARTICARQLRVADDGMATDTTYTLETPMDERPPGASPRRRSRSGPAGLRLDPVRQEFLLSATCSRWISEKYV